MGSWMNVNDTTLNIRNFKELGQPEWILHLLTLYHVIVVVMCITGNITVLIASWKYNAVELDEVSLALLQNLAVADILVGSLRGIPVLVSGITRRWVFGRSLCWFLGLVYWLPQKVEFTTIMVVSLHRIYNLLFPLSTRGLKTSRATRSLCAVIWAVISGAICLDTYLRIPVQFDIFSQGCSVYGHVGAGSSPVLVLLWLVMTLILVVLPLLLTLLSNLLILILATYYRFQHTGRAVPSRNAFVTVTLVAWSFLLSVLPAVLVYAMVGMSTGSQVPSLVVMLAWECLSINIWINPIIYTVINSRFRSFVAGIFSNGLKNLRARGQVTPI